MENEKSVRPPVIGITLDVDGEYLRLKRHYPPAVRRAGGIPLLIPHANDARVIARIIDGLLVPGGGDIDPSYYSEPQLRVEAAGKSRGMVSKDRTGFEIDLLKAIMELRKPVLGICYGMQLINVALGGSLYQDIGVQFGMTIDHTKGIHKVLGKGNLLGGEFVVNSTHHQAVKRIGNGLSPLACSEDNIVEAFEAADYPFLVGVQWHPERSDDALSVNLIRSFVESAHVHE